MQFLFYDLETSGISAKWQRIMQFAAVRTDENLKPIGSSIQHLISLTDEILPEPPAILLTGITPQQSVRDGLSEADFWKEIYPELTQGQTTITGFNSIRFDDEFIRYSLWRNFRDPYAWAYERDNSRWDLLDVARMYRALRPTGLEWPLKSDESPTNRLEDLARANAIEHSTAHSALGDVEATIDLARLMKKSQPKLWDWLLGLRFKKVVQNFVAEQDGAFIYTSGSYPKENQHTTLVSKLAPIPRGDGVWVYDLRVDPDEWLDRTDEQLKVAYSLGEKIPVKQLKFNKAPAVAPLSVLDDTTADRLKIDRSRIEANTAKLRGKDLSEFLQRTLTAREEHYGAYQQVEDADGQLYDGFLEDKERLLAGKVAQASKSELEEMQPDFADERLKELFLRYKARNFPQLLKQTEVISWDTYRQGRLKATYGMNLEKYYSELNDLGQNPDLTDSQREILTELDLWAQSLTAGQE